MPHRNQAKYLALAGVIRGVSQGVSDYRTENRRASLREIELRYRAAERADNRAYQERRDADNRKFQEGLVDKRNTNAIALFEKGRETNWNDPNLPGKYSNVDEARQANDPTLLIPREKEGTTPSSIAATDEYMARGEEFQRKFDRINKVSDQQGGLSSKQQAKYVVDQLSAFNELDDGYQRDALEAWGLDATLTGAKRRDAVIKYHRETVKSIDKMFQSPSGNAIGLFDSPGSSQSNPVDASSFSSKPPSGTWVRLPDGRVVQIP